MGSPFKLLIEVLPTDILPCESIILGFTGPALDPIECLPALKLFTDCLPAESLLIVMGLVLPPLL